jgi:hypothetical protein
VRRRRPGGDVEDGQILALFEGLFNARRMVIYATCAAFSGAPAVVSNHPLAG